MDPAAVHCPGMEGLARKDPRGGHDSESRATIGGAGRLAATLLFRRG